MKIRNLKNYGIPSYILNIWEKHYSPYLLPLQEDAVRNYGILNCNKNNLLVIAPTSSGKSFIGEMAALSQVIHQKKIIYLVPLRSPAEEKYRHFKNLYSSCGLEMVISTRNRREEDCRIIRGNYKIAIMVYEKFNYFLLKYPNFLDDVSLVIIDEMQMINNPKWGPLLEDIIEYMLKKDLRNLRIIALSAFIESQEALLKWFPAQTLTSYQYPVELRKGIVRDGTFKYITSSKMNIFRKEVFFKPKLVRDNCFEGYLLETVRYLINQGEATLIFFATCTETRQWAKWLASRLESPAASSALKELKGMEETSSRDELLELLEKGIAYHNQDLSWEEKNLVETYLKKGEIKIICATTIMAMDLNLPFKNVIIPLDKIHNNDEDCIHSYRTSINFADIENMGGRAGILNIEKYGNSVRKGQKFGRVIFLAHSPISETAYKNLYFEFLKNNNNNTVTKHLVKKEKDLLTYLLRLLVKCNFKPKKIKKYLKKEDDPSSYWGIIFPEGNIDEEINNCLHVLKENKLTKEDNKGILSLTPNGILIAAKRIKVETYLFFKTWINYSRKGEISKLEILYLLSQTPDGKELPIPFCHNCINDYKKDEYNCQQEEVYVERILHLISEQNEEDKQLYQNNILLKKCKEDEVFSLEEHLSFKKILLVYDWIRGNMNVKIIEQEYKLYQGAIYRLGEGFSWLADSLAVIAENAGWKKKRKEDLNQIKLLSNRLIEGVEEEGLNLANLYIPGLSRYYIRRLVGAGYGDEECLKEAREEELAKVLPKRLVDRIQKRFNDSLAEEDRHKVCPYRQDDSSNLKINTLLASPCNSAPHRLNTIDQRLTTTPSRTSQPKTENRELKTVLQIDIHRPDRIIFEGKEVKVTAIGFSLIHLLAQNRGKILTHNDLLGTIWKGDREATYVRITYHLYKIRRNILKIIGKNKKNKEKVKDILKAVSRRGIMLNLAKNKLNII